MKLNNMQKFRFTLGRIQAGLESAEISSGPFNRLLEPQNEFIGKVRKDVKHLTETVNKEA